MIATVLLIQPPTNHYAINTAEQNIFFSSVITGAGIVWWFAYWGDCNQDGVDWNSNYQLGELCGSEEDGSWQYWLFFTAVIRDLANTCQLQLSLPLLVCGEFPCLLRCVKVRLWSLTWTHYIISILVTLSTILITLVCALINGHVFPCKSALLSSFADTITKLTHFSFLWADSTVIHLVYNLQLLKWHRIS